IGRTETCSGLSTRAFAICSMSSFIDPPNSFCALVCRRGMFVCPCPVIPLLKCSHLLLPQPSTLGSMPFQQIRRALCKVSLRLMICWVFVALPWSPNSGSALTPRRQECHPGRTLRGLLQTFPLWSILQHLFLLSDCPLLS